MTENQVFAYAGGWTIKGGEPGIWLHIFDQETGEMTFVKKVDEEASIGFSFVDRENKILYCTHEGQDLPGLRVGGGGRVFAFHIDPETGDLTELCKVPSFATNASYLTLDATGRYMVVANHGNSGPITKSFQDAYGEYHLTLEYDDATVALFPVDEHGAVGKPCDIVKHTGSGPLPRQTMPHPHSALLSPDGKLIAVCDKGNDHIYMYRIDYEHKKLEQCTAPTAVPPGSRPRHCVFHPDKPYFYANHEGLLQLSGYRYDEDGKLELIGRFDLLPEGTETNGKASQGICIHPSGKYIYNLTHGGECVSVMGVNEETGELTLLQTAKLNSSWPRGCNISPNGKFLVVAEYEANELIVLCIASDGTLQIVNRVAQPSPANVAFFKA